MIAMENLTPITLAKLSEEKTGGNFGYFKYFLFFNFLFALAVIPI